METFFTSYITTLFFVAGGYIFAWRVLADRFFALLAAGWVLNAVYLALEQSAFQELRNPLAVLLASVTSTILFHSAVLSQRNNLKPSEGTEPEKHQRYPFIGALVFLVTILIDLILLEFGVPAKVAFFFYSLLPSAYSVFVLALVSMRIGRKFPEDNYGYPSRILAGSWGLYALIQIFYPFRFTPNMESFVSALFFLAFFLKLSGGLALLFLLRLTYEELQRRANHVSVISELGNLAAGIHHDIATPLGTVDLALAELSAHRNDDKVVRKFLRIIDEPLRTIDGALQVINIARQDTEAISNQFVPINARATVNRAFRLYKKGFSGKSPIRLIAPEGSKDYLVLANLDLLGSAFLNILKNAHEADARYVRVEISRTADGEFVEYHFQNDGRQLTDEEAANCTKAGWTSKRKTVSRANRGMGLFMASRIARMHRGDFRIWNQEEGDQSLVVVRVRIPASRRT